VPWGDLSDDLPRYEHVAVETTPPRALVWQLSQMAACLDVDEACAVMSAERPSGQEEER
jgi:hypothetical protein